MLLLRLYSLAPGAASVAFGAFALRLCITLAGLALGLALAFSLEAALQQNYSRSAWLLACLALAAASRGGLLYAAEAYGSRHGARFRRDLRARIFSHLIRLGPAYLTGRRTGELQGTVVGAVDNVETWITRFVPVAGNALAGTLAALATIAVFAPEAAAGLAVFAVLGPAISIGWLAWRLRLPATRGIFAAIQESNAYLLESIQGLTTLKLFGATARRRDVIAEKADRMRSRSMATLRINLARSGLTTLVALGGAAAVVVWMIYGVVAGSVTSLALLVVMILAPEVFRPFQALEAEFHGGIGGTAAARSVTGLLATPLPDVSAGHAHPRGTEIRFEDVTFTHEGAAAPVLKGASMVIGPGDHVALAGASGAGKSTVADLLLGFLRPQGGSVSIGGVAVDQIADTQLRDLVAVVSQSPYIFPGTVAENVRMGRPDASDEEVVEACVVADADGFIRARPGGYAAEVGEAGGRLSTGQKQRLAIARAVLRNAPVLVLDEATSNLDVETEARIQTRLSAHRIGQTTIVIGHRPSALRGARRTLTVADGHLCETRTGPRAPRQPELTGGVA